MKAKCECTFNNFINNQIVSGFDIGGITDAFTIISSINIEVFQCILDIFKLEYFKKCIGGFFILGLTIIQIICIFSFLINGLHFISNHIFSLIESFSLYKQKHNLNNPPKKKSKKSKKNIKGESLDNFSQSTNTKNQMINIIHSERDKKKNSNTLIFDKYNIFEKGKFEKTEKNNINPKFKEESNEYYNKINEYLNISFYEKDFYDVLDKETRSFGTYFYEKFKENQIIVNTFCLNEIFRPKPFKIILFIITIELYFVINGLFYNEEYLSELFNSNEPEYFFSFVPRRIAELFYTSCVSIIISYLIGCFSIEEEKIKRIFVKFKKDELKIKYELSLILKTIKIRFYLFFIFSLFLSIVSFVYICCFNIVYPYIRIEWIKSSIFIFIVMQIITILLTFLESSLRYLAIKCNSEKIFKLSLLLN